jgi:uncharacterized protein with von Willebrand factor type A (vWA) domain
MTRAKGLNNIEADSFDREAYSGLVSSSSELRELVERGSTLLPGFGPLMEDLFASFFKHNVVFLPESTLRKSALLPRRIIKEVLADGAYKEMREETVLDEFHSALAAVEMGRSVLEWLRSEDGPGERSLVKEWQTDAAESEVDEMRDEMETWEENEGGDENEAFKKLRDEKKRELGDAEEEMGDLAEELEGRHEKSSVNLKKMVKASMKETSEKIENSEDEIQSWSSSMGAPAERPAGEKLDLAAKLYTNEKLRRLSLLVGSLKEEMLRGRRKSWSRRGAEVFDIASGDDIGRIIPSELVLLARPALSSDFKKRLVEGRLLQYSLREEKGRGPMVVCLDGSSSMEGNKELWSKGVCLTLLEIAKRERRKAAIIVFSSGGQPGRVFETDPREGKGGWGMREQDVFELAEYFPGGGTNFEEPLDRALGILAESKFRRGDIVFITDGEAAVGGEWLEKFRREKSRLGFKVYSVLIDVSGKESWESLSGFSDKVTSVSRLTSEEAGGIFIDL